MEEKNIVEGTKKCEEPPTRFCEYEIVFKWHEREMRRNYRAIFDDIGGLVGGYSFRDDEVKPKEVYCGLQPVVIPGVCPITKSYLKRRTKDKANPPFSEFGVGIIDPPPQGATSGVRSSSIGSI